MTGPNQFDWWCCTCGAEMTDTNSLEECPVSRIRMLEMGAKEGLSHLWAQGTHQRAMVIWNDDKNVRARIEQEKLEKVQKDAEKQARKMANEQT